MGFWGWIVAIIIGGIIGWLASMVMNRNASMGIFWNIVVGIVGALIGALIGGGGVAGLAAFSIWSLIAAFIGAVVLLAIVNLIQRGRVR